MPAQPLPAEGAGEFVIRYYSEPHHVRAVLLRRASTGALVELGTERVSYSIAQDVLAGEDSSIPYSDELGWVGDPEELGAIGKRIKKFAKHVAKSKLGKLVKSAGKLATSFVPGGSAITGGLAAARTLKKGVKAAKSLKRKRHRDPDIAAAREEVGAVGAAGKRPPSRKPAPKAAPKPKAKAAPKPKAAAKPKPKAAPKPKAKAAPKPKAAAKPKPKAAPKPKPKPKASKPHKTAAAKLAKVQQAGGAKATLARSAAAADTPAKRAQATQLAALVDQIEDDAPELAATLATLPETDPEDRDGVDDRAVVAAQKLAATPPAERGALAAKLEKRIDGYKVTAPSGETVWVPAEEVETDGDDGGGGDDGGNDGEDD